MRASRTPLAVAAGCYALGGLGNVAFSLHNGSQLGLLFVRFLLGAVFAAGWLAWRRPAPPALRPVRHPRVALHATGALEACAIACLMLAAGHVGTLVFTAIGITGPALVALAAVVLRLPQPTWRGLVLAGACLAAAGASVAASGEGGGGTTRVGVALAVASTVLGVGATLTGVYAASVYAPARLVRTTCLWGVVGIAVLAAGGREFVVTPTTLAVAAFIAAVPGGIAKAGVAWSAARTSPALVASLVSVAVPVAAIGAWGLLGQAPTPWQLTWALVGAGAGALLVRYGRRDPYGHEAGGAATRQSC